MEQIEMADDIIIFPEFDKIKNEIEKLRIELSMLLLERDELQFVICRNIEAKYTLEFGSIEYRAYELRFKFLCMNNAGIVEKYKYQRKIRKFIWRIK